MAAKNLLIGINLGTTALKVAAFAADSGRLLATASRRLPTRVAADGTREQDLADLRRHLAAAFSEVRQAVGDEAWSRAAGIGLAAQGGSGALFERRSGAPQTPLHLWNDSRAAALLPEVAAGRPAAYWRELSQRRGPGMGLARMLWLQRRRPGAFDGDAIYAGVGEAAFHMMTGRWCQDACNALQMGCYNVLENRLDEEPLALLGLGLRHVAPLREGHGLAALSRDGAALLGLRAGLPVAGPYMDHEAGYLSAAGAFPRPLQCSLGTAWVGNFVVPTPRCGWSPVQLVIAAPPPETGSLVIQPLLTGNVSWDWGLQCFLDRDHGAALGKAAALLEAALLPPPGLICLPWFTQGNPWLAGSAGAGVFAGGSAGVTCDDMVRALAAGLCCEFYRVFRDLKRTAAVDGVVLGGGASKGAFFRTLLAGLFAPLPVVLCADEDTGGARGALVAFSERVCRSQTTPVPAPAEAVRTALCEYYETYARTFDGIYGAHPAGAPYRLT